MTKVATTNFRPLRAFLAPPFCPYVLAWPQLPANLRDSTVISRNRYHRHCQHRWNHRPLNLNFLSFFLSRCVNLLNSKSLEQGKTIKESMKIFIAFLLWDIIREEWIEHWNILKKIKMHRNWISLTSLTFIERKWKTIEFVWNSHRHHRDPPLFASFSP